MNAKSRISIEQRLDPLSVPINKIVTLLYSILQNDNFRKTKIEEPTQKQ